jgi:AraC-like DNA-binding protein
MATQTRPAYTLKLASQQAVSAEWEDPANRNERRTLNAKLVAITAKNNLGSYNSSANDAARLAINYLVGNGKLSWVEAVNLDVEQLATALRTGKAPKKAGQAGRKRDPDRDGDILEASEICTPKEVAKQFGFKSRSGVSRAQKRAVECENLVLEMFESGANAEQVKEELGFKEIFNVEKAKQRAMKHRQNSGD